MKIIFYIDGTLTDYNAFIDNKAIPFIIQNYHLKIKNIDFLEIEEIFDIDEQDKNKIIKRFWKKNFISFFTLKFRKGVKPFFKQIRNKNHTIEIHTSRRYSCGNNIKSIFVRILTWIQFILNGIFVTPSSIFFYLNDDAKINGIINANADLVFDDKPKIIEKLSQNDYKVIYIKGRHNQTVTINRNMQHIESFNLGEIDRALNGLFGANLKYYDKEAKSSMYFNRLKPLCPLFLFKFKPLILNKENICLDSSTGIVYAPNHRSTWDPIIISAILCTHIHWAALLRFFEGEDSVFNNSKKAVLRKITKKILYYLECIPIERKSDNENANNITAIKDMNNYLKIKSKIGIFGEGTTRRPPQADFGNFDRTFIALAKKNHSIIQPITILWVNDKRIKVIVNFGEPFSPENMSIDLAMEYFMNTQSICLKENKKLMNRILKD